MCHLQICFAKKAKAKLKPLNFHILRQTTNLTTDLYNGQNHHIFFSGVETIIRANDDIKCFFIRDTSKEEVSILTQANLIIPGNVKTYLDHWDKHYDAKRKSSRKYYYIGMFYKLETSFKSKVFANYIEIQGDEIRLIWWLYAFFRQIHDLSRHDIERKIADLSLEKFENRNIGKFVLK